MKRRIIIALVCMLAGCNLSHRTPLKNKILSGFNNIIPSSNSSQVMLYYNPEKNIYQYVLVNQTQTTDTQQYNIQTISYSTLPVNYVPLQTNNGYYYQQPPTNTLYQPSVDLVSPYQYYPYTQNMTYPGIYTQPTINEVNTSNIIVNNNTVVSQNNQQQQPSYLPTY